MDWHNLVSLMVSGYRLKLTVIARFSNPLVKYYNLQHTSLLTGSVV